MNLRSVAVGIVLGFVLWFFSALYFGVIVRRPSPGRRFAPRDVGSCRR